VEAIGSPIAVAEALEALNAPGSPSTTARPSTSHPNDALDSRNGTCTTFSREGVTPFQGRFRQAPR
jgi:hypothetical protein